MVEINYHNVKQVVESSSQSSRSSSPESNKAKVKCFYCNKNGHIARNCYKKKANEKSRTASRHMHKTVPTCLLETASLPKTTGILNSFEVSFSFDSGAVVSILWLKLARKLGIEVLRSNKSIKTATNEVSSVIGETSPMKVDIKGHCCDLPFIVLDMEDHDVLLGLDWFEESGAGIYLQQKLLKIKSHIIRLNGNELSCGDQRDSPRNVFVSEVVESVSEDGTDGLDDDGCSVRIPFMKPASKLCQDEIIGFENLRYELRNCFAGDFESFEKCDVRKRRIILTNNKPILYCPYRESETDRKEMKVENESLFEDRSSDDRVKIDLQSTRTAKQLHQFIDHCGYYKHGNIGYEKLCDYYLCDFFFSFFSSDNNILI